MYCCVIFTFSCLLYVENSNMLITDELLVISYRFWEYFMLLFLHLYVHNVVVVLSC